MRKRQAYYPSRLEQQPEWLGNFGTKLPGVETVLGLPPAHVDACVACCNYLSYVIGTWLIEVRAFGPAATAALDLLTGGSGPAPVVLPVFTAPALPVGVAAVPPGALNLIFDMVALIKASPGYTEVIGKDLRIIGSEDAAAENAAQALPAIKATVVDGTGQQAVRFTFIKHGHAGVYAETKRGNGDWEFMAIDTESPYVDDRKLLEAGKPEVRQYRFRYWDKGTPNGDWCDVIIVTVGP